MRRALLFVIASAVALAATAVAIADTAHDANSATADFTAAKTGDVQSRTCTGVNGDTFTITNGRYAGTMTSSNPLLNGDLTIRARTLVDTTTAPKLGTVDGMFQVKSGDSRTFGRFSGTLSDGNLVGFLDGMSGPNHARVLGNMSATLAADTGFTVGKVGSGGSLLALVVSHPCKRSDSGHGDKPKPAKPDHPSRPSHVEIYKGTVTSDLTKDSTTITVHPKQGDDKTCAVTAGTSPSVADVKKDTPVIMTCGKIGTSDTLTLLKLWKLAPA
jgi:hypothetical protein